MADDTDGFLWGSFNAAYAVIVGGSALLVYYFRHREFNTPEELNRLQLYTIRELYVVAIGLGLISVMMFAALSIQLLLSMHRKPKIFISYFHEFEPLAEQLSAALDGLGMASIYRPFTPGGHDAILKDVREKLDQSDAVVVLAGPRPSFVDYEVFAASVQKKPIILIKKIEADTLPESAFTGYPVFSLARLSRRRFMPLSHFLALACNHWSDAARNTLRMVFPIVQVATIIGFVVFLLDYLWGVAKLVFMMLYLPSFAIRLESIFAGLLMIIMAVATAVSIALVVWHKIKSIRVCQQRIISGNLTFGILSEALSVLPGDQAILDCLEREPLQPRHP